MPICDYWELVLIELEQTVSPGKYKAWLENLEFISTSERSSVINLSTISRFAKDYIEKKLEKPLLTAVQKYFTKVVKINFEVRERIEKIEQLAQNKIEVENLEPKNYPNYQKKASLSPNFDSYDSSNLTNYSDNSQHSEQFVSAKYSKYKSKKQNFETKNEIKTANQEIFLRNDKTPEEIIQFEKKDWQINQNSTQNSGQNGIFPAQNLNNLNSKYTFENLVVSGYNELAVAVAKSILKELGTLYNPVFIHSKVGLGKTHLLQAIGQKALENDPTLKIKYATSETFFNHYLMAIQKNQSLEFRRHYRDVDLLLLDDIQFINGKNSTQEAFFHTFNELHQQNKQIIITSDKHPDELGLIEERLVSRFKWGMVVDLSIPNLEDKMAILRDKVERQKIVISEDQILQIAQKPTTNIRELEGILNQIKLKTQIEESEQKNNKNEQNPKTEKDKKEEYIDQKWLNSILDKTSEKNSSNSGNNSNFNSTNKVIQITAQVCGLNSKQIIGQNRDKDSVEARQIIMYLWHKKFHLSFSAIAKMLGKKNHTTILHGVAKIQEELLKKPNLQTKLDQIIQNLN